LASLHNGEPIQASSFLSRAPCDFRRAVGTVIIHQENVHWTVVILPQQGSDCLRDRRHLISRRHNHGNSPAWHNRDTWRQILDFHLPESTARKKQVNPDAQRQRRKTFSNHVSGIIARCSA
jgi:hypothetical protein